MATIFPVPKEHDIFPAFTLPNHEGRDYDVGALRQHRNLVLCFVPKPERQSTEFLRRLAGESERIDAAEAAVIIVIGGSPPAAASLRSEFHLPFSVLADVDGSLVRQLAQEGPTVFVTDRFREVFFGRPINLLTDPVAEVVSQLEFIEYQCPE